MFSEIRQTFEGDRWRTALQSWRGSRTHKTNSKTPPATAVSINHPPSKREKIPPRATSPAVAGSKPRRAINSPGSPTRCRQETLKTTHRKQSTTPVVKSNTNKIKTHTRQEQQKTAGAHMPTCGKISNTRRKSNLSWFRASVSSKITLMTGQASKTSTNRINETYVDCLLYIPGLTIPRVLGNGPSCQLLLQEQTRLRA